MAGQGDPTLGVNELPEGGFQMKVTGPADGAKAFPWQGGGEHPTAGLAADAALHKPAEKGALSSSAHRYQIGGGSAL